MANIKMFKFWYLFKTKQENGFTITCKLSIFLFAHVYASPRDHARLLESHVTFLYTIQNSCITGAKRKMSEHVLFTIEAVLRGYHVYKAILSDFIGTEVLYP